MIKKIYAYTLDEIKFLDAQGIRYPYIAEVEDIPDNIKEVIQNDPEIILCLETYVTVDNNTEEDKPQKMWRVLKAKYSLYDLEIPVSMGGTSPLVGFSLDYPQYCGLVKGYNNKILKTSGSFGDLLLKQIYPNTKPK